MTSLENHDAIEPWNPMWMGPRRGAAWLQYANGHPASLVLGLIARSADEKGQVFHLQGPPAPNPNGSVHGGMLAAALDNVLALTAMTGMPDDGLPNTVAMGVRYLRPAMPPLEIRSRVRRGGRSLVFVEADVFSADRLCATADGTLAVVTPDHVGQRANS